MSIVEVNSTITQLWLNGGCKSHHVPAFGVAPASFQIIVTLNSQNKDRTTTSSLPQESHGLQRNVKIDIVRDIPSDLNTFEYIPTWLPEAQQAPAAETLDLRNSSWCCWVCGSIFSLKARTIICRSRANINFRRVRSWKGRQPTAVP